MMILSRNLLAAASGCLILAQLLSSRSFSSSSPFCPAEAFVIRPALTTRPPPRTTTNSVSGRVRSVARSTVTSATTSAAEEVSIAKSPVGDSKEDSSSVRTRTKKKNDLDLKEAVATPVGSCSKAWEVHKFGGASLATAELYRTVGDLLVSEAASASAASDSNDSSKHHIPTMAIVSAMGGMTDLLVKVVDSSLTDFEQATLDLNDAVERAVSVLRELAPPEITEPIEARFRNDARDILSLVQSLRMINTVPPVTMEVVSGFGEIWSAQTLWAYLQTKREDGTLKSNPAWIDARDVLVVQSESSGLGEKGESSSTGGVVPLWHETAAKMTEWWETTGTNEHYHFDKLDYTEASPIVVVTGFVAKTLDGVPTTLKRSGSDYSATVFAKLVGASRVTMWKNTDGVYTADPRRVPEAFPIKSLKYDEAIELAYFGAQVLHPSAMVPCIDNNIPVYVRNIFNPSFEGTIIQGRCPLLKDVTADGTTARNKVQHWRANRGTIPIKGITSVDKIALVTLEGASVIGGAACAKRLMQAMDEKSISVLMVTQASSESSICIAVPENQGPKALRALQSAFELELARSTVSSVSLCSGMSIVAIVGEGMALNSGVSATFMSSMAKANVNIRCIAQGSSERQIAVVVDGNDTSRALRAAHMAFTLSETVASVAILGCTGKLGSAFVQQLESQKKMLSDELGIGIKLTVAACRTKVTVGKDYKGLELGQLSSMLRDENCIDFDLDMITDVMESDVNPHRVLIDCTNSEEVSDCYARWLSSGINIISPNRKLNAGPLENYKRTCEVMRDNAVTWQYESSVGAALPILTTLKDLQETGDKVRKIRGALSGSLAYVFNTMSEDVTFTEALRQAIDQDFAETDIREDLSGLDSARKVVILARELGMEVDVSDVEIESLLTDDVANALYDDVSQPGELNDRILKDLECRNENMLELLKSAEADGCRLRYKFEIDVESGKCSVGLAAVDTYDTLFRLKSNENLVSFETTRYTTSPLIIKGAAAGPNLAAAGIFADLLRRTRTFSSVQI